MDTARPRTTASSPHLTTGSSSPTQAESSTPDLAGDATEGFAAARSDDARPDEATLVAQFLAAEHRFQQLLDDCIAGRPALSRIRLTALSGFLDSTAWRGVDALESLQQRPVGAVAEAIVQASQNDDQGRVDGPGEIGRVVGHDAPGDDRDVVTLSVDNNLAAADLTLGRPGMGKSNWRVA